MSCSLAGCAGGRPILASLSFRWALCTLPTHAQAFISRLPLASAPLRLGYFLRCKCVATRALPLEAASWGSRVVRTSTIHVFSDICCIHGCGERLGMTNSMPSTRQALPLSVASSGPVPTPSRKKTATANLELVARQCTSRHPSQVKV